MSSPPPSSHGRPTVYGVGFGVARDGDPTRRPVTVLHVDKHAMFSDAVSRCLAEEPGLLPSGAVSTYELARVACRKASPDVILIDPWTEGSGGIEAVRSLRAVSPRSAVVVVTDRGDAEAIASSIRAGVRGYVLKSRRITELISAIWEVTSGQTIVTMTDAPGVLRGLRPTAQVDVDAARAFRKLTVRERQILAELTAGNSTAKIAGRLHISPLTVRSHVKSLMSKLGVHSRLEAVTLAMRHGMFEDERPA